MSTRRLPCILSPIGRRTTGLALALALVTLIGAGPATGAPSFPTNCALYPDDCAGAALASRFGTRGLNDNPRFFNPAIHPPEVAMYRVTMNLAAFPDAVCNDGSPAVFYFAPAPPGSDNADNWVIQLEGGGSCLSAQDEDGLHQDCMDRWTGRGSALLDFPRKMSTDLNGNGVTDLAFLPIEGRIPGLLGVNTVVTDPTNNGGADAWNRLFLNYCSSDLWRGQSGAQPLDDGEWVDAAGGTHTYEPLSNAYFHGHLILESVLAAVAVGVVSDDDERRLRLERAPAKVLLVGESAGGGGVLANLDYVASHPIWGVGATLGVAGAATVPPFAYDDATVPWYNGPQTVQEWDFSLTPPQLVDVDLDGNGIIDTHDREAGTALRRGIYEPILNAFVDQSCLAANTDPFAADPDQRHWLCYSAEPLLVDGHITTPLLIKQDLADPLMSAGVPAFADGVRTTMANVPGNVFSFGPRCAHHESLSRTSWFKRDRVIDPATGRQVSYHSAIAELISGVFVSIYFEPGVTTRNCAP